MTQPPDDLRASVLNAVAQESSPTRAQTQQRLGRLLIGTVLAMMAAAFVVGANPGERDLGRVLLVAGGLAVMVAAGLIAILWRNLPNSGGRVALALAIAAPLLLVLVGADPSRPSMTTTLGAHAACALMTVAVAVGPAAALLFARRWSDPINPTRTAALAVAAASGFSALLVHLHCPDAGLHHLALGHAAPIWILIGCGVLFGRRIVWPRTTP